MVDALVLFDVDGTLVDGEAQICDTMADAFLAAGRAAPERWAIRAVIGLSLPEMVERLASGRDAAEIDKIVAGYRLRFADAMDRMEDPPIYTGAERAIRRLRAADVTLGLATGKSRLGLAPVLDATGWHRYFATVQCADDNPSKPDPTMIRKALTATGVDPARCFMVGDTLFDMRMAREAGVRAIGVSWGYQPASLLTEGGAEAVADDFHALVDLLLEKIA